MPKKHFHPFHLVLGLLCSRRDFSKRTFPWPAVQPEPGAECTSRTHLNVTSFMPCGLTSCQLQSILYSPFTDAASAICLKFKASLKTNFSITLTSPGDPLGNLIFLHESNCHPTVVHTQKCSQPSRVKPPHHCRWSPRVQNRALQLPTSCCSPCFLNSARTHMTDITR